METLIGLAEALEASPYGVWARESAIAYPLANLLHLLGLVLLLGGIGLVDLRLAGLFPRLPLAPLARALTPLALAGLALLALSGSAMFAADAAPLAVSGTFRWKLALIALALLNAIAFRIAWNARLSSGAAIPAAARVSAVASIALWLTVAALGRLIAYN